ncbi:HNH endonuclease [Priestia aryabhattai]|uniref:HNH endonuclease n=1 Tax=Priestia megaterium TaxID=1404 RepID=UPI003F9951ED
MKVCEVCGVTSEKTKIYGTKSRYTNGMVLCRKHMQQVKAHGEIRDGKLHQRKGRDNLSCDVCGKTDGQIIKSTLYKATLCKNHYAQYERNGFALKKSPFESNDINVFEGYAEIVLRDRVGNITESTIIDLENIDNLSMYKWSLHKSGYAHAKIDGRHVLMHRFIMGVHNDDRFDVDHEDRNKLNNRKSNLRTATRQQNTINKDKRVDNTTGIIGVYYRKDSGKWMAKVSIDKKSVSLGTFIKFEDAVIARLKGELKYYGEEFAPQRQLFKEYGITKEDNHDSSND